MEFVPDETAISHISLSQTALSQISLETAPPQDIESSTLSTSEGFTFTILPTEIRLLIYKELLVRNSRPELCFCSADLHTAYSHTPKVNVHPTILRTCQTIYYEALPILYADNVFELLCVFGKLGKQCLWYRTCGPSPLLECPSPHGSFYLKQVFLTYTDICCTRNETGLTSTDIAQSARYWPRIEQETLELYPNITSIFVQIHQERGHSICLKLARRHRSHNAEAKRDPDYQAVLKELDLTRAASDGGGYPYPVRRLIEQICATTLYREKCGLMQGTVFGVQSVRLGSGFGKNQPSWEEFDICDIYLGCEQ